MHKELKVFLKVGSAICMGITEDFANMECDHPMAAHQLQEMLDLGWELMFSPNCVGSNQTTRYHHTFRKVK